MPLTPRITLYLGAALALLLVPACEYEAHSGIRGGDVTSAFPPQDGGTPVDPFGDGGLGSPPMSDGGLPPSRNDAGRPHTLDAGRRPGTSIDGGSDAGPPPPPPPTDAGTDAGIAPPPPPPPPPPTNCPLAGSWRLDQVLCGGADYTSSFLRPGIVARLIFSERPSGGCFLAFELAGSSCREYEEGHMTAVGTSWTMQSYGVTSCSPPGCRYGSWDSTSCTIGAGRGTYSADFQIDSSGTRLIDTRVTSEVACASVGRLPQVATWIRE